LQTNPETKTINPSFPETEGEVCGRELERRVGAMYHNISTLVEPLESGEMLIRVMPD